MRTTRVQPNPPAIGSERDRELIEAQARLWGRANDAIQKLVKKNGGFRAAYEENLEIRDWRPINDWCNEHRPNASQG